MCYSLIGRHCQNLRIAKKVLGCSGRSPLLEKAAALQRGQENEQEHASEEDHPAPLLLISGERSQHCGDDEVRVVERHD